MRAKRFSDGTKLLKLSRFFKYILFVLITIQGIWTFGPSEYQVYTDSSIEGFTLDENSRMTPFYIAPAYKTSRFFWFEDSQVFQPIHVDSLSPYVTDDYFFINNLSEKYHFKPLPKYKYIGTLVLFLIGFGYFSRSWQMDRRFLELKSHGSSKALETYRQWAKSNIFRYMHAYPSLKRYEREMNKNRHMAMMNFWVIKAGMGLESEQPLLIKLIDSALKENEDEISVLCSVPELEKSVIDNNLLSLCGVEPDLHYQTLKKSVEDYKNSLSDSEKKELYKQNPYIYALNDVKDYTNFLAPNKEIGIKVLEEAFCDYLNKRVSELFGKNLIRFKPLRCGMTKYVLAVSYNAGYKPVAGVSKGKQNMYLQDLSKAFLPRASFNGEFFKSFRSSILTSTYNLYGSLIILEDKEDVVSINFQSVPDSDFVIKAFNTTRKRFDKTEIEKEKMWRLNAISNLGPIFNQLMGHSIIDSHSENCDKKAIDIAKSRQKELKSIKEEIEKIVFEESKSELSESVAIEIYKRNKKIIDTYTSNVLKASLSAETIELLAEIVGGNIDDVADILAEARN